MDAIYDQDSDTLQVPNTRYLRERDAHVIVPEWDALTWRDGTPDWLFDAIIDGGNTRGDWLRAYDALGIPRP